MDVDIHRLGIELPPISISQDIDIEMECQYFCLDVLVFGILTWYWCECQILFGWSKWWIALVWEYNHYTGFIHVSKCFRITFEYIWIIIYHMTIKMISQYYVKWSHQLITSKEHEKMARKLYYTHENQNIIPSPMHNPT